MEIKIEKKDKHAKIEIISEDLALGHILRKELIENKIGNSLLNINVAGVYPAVEKLRPGFGYWL